MSNTADVTDALGNVRACQRQLDADGTEVGVSRQALEEVIEEVDKARAQRGRAGAVVLKMRDDWLDVAKAFTTLHSYDAAMEAIGIAQSLEKFESEHDITNVEWPLRLEPDQYATSGKQLAEAEV